MLRGMNMHNKFMVETDSLLDRSFAAHEGEDSLSGRVCSHSVLIVDPDPNTRGALRSILTDINIRPLEAETVDQARALLAASTIHVAMVEVGLRHQAGDLLASDLDTAGIIPVLMSATAFGTARARRTN